MQERNTVLFKKTKPNQSFQKCYDVASVWTLFLWFLMNHFVQHRLSLVCERTYFICRYVIDRLAMVLHPFSIANNVAPVWFLLEMAVPQWTVCCQIAKGWALFFPHPSGLNISETRHWVWFIFWRTVGMDCTDATQRRAFSLCLCVLISIFNIWICTACEAVILKEIINHLKSCRTSLLMHRVALKE